MGESTEHENFHGASIRISSSNYSDFEWLEKETGLIPTTKGKKGEPRFTGNKRCFPCNIWILDSPLAKSEELSRHLEWLWNQVKNHVKTLNHLI